MNEDEILKKIEKLQERINTLEAKDDIEKYKLIISMWEKIVDTQMHFNDMVMRVRNLAITLILAVFGAAAYSLQYQKNYMFLTINGHHVHIAVLIIVFGLAGWIGFFILDRLHFHNLLRGAVEKGMELEKTFIEKDAFLKDLLGMTTLITKYSRSEIWGISIYAGRKISAFYLVVLVVGVVYSYVVFKFMTPSKMESNKSEHILKIVPEKEGNYILEIKQRDKSALPSENKLSKNGKPSTND